MAQNEHISLDAFICLSHRMYSYWKPVEQILITFLLGNLASNPSFRQYLKKVNSLHANALGRSRMSIITREGINYLGEKNKSNWNLRNKKYTLRYTK
jgi:hypothetical protein